MQGDGELDDAEIRAQVAASGGDPPDEFLADLCGEVREPLRGEGPKVAGVADPLE